MSKNKKKGLEYKILFIFALVLLVLITVVTVWSFAGREVAAQRMGELKITTVVQIKNILLLMQSAPVETTACASLKNCNKVEISNNYIEIWGPANDYFKEDDYLSTSLIGDTKLYMYDETCAAQGEGCDLWEEIKEDKSFVTPCDVYICFRKVGDKEIYIEPKGK